MQKQQSMTTGMRLQTVLAMTCLVLLSGYSISRALQASSGMMSEAEAAELSSRPAPAADAATIQLTPIEQLQVGDRVLANAPTEEVDLQFGTDIVPADWRKLTLLAPKRDGSTADVILLRPLTWLKEQRQSGTSIPTERTLADGEPPESFHDLVGGTVFISVPECGIDGHAQVLAIEPCPEILPGEGRVITGTFRHQVSASISLSIAAQAEPILCTGNHPFWSEDRHEFVRADSLQPKETLRTTTGTTNVTSLSHIPGSTTVYNLEVHGTHVYHVGTSGVLVHNGDPADCIEWAARNAKRIGGETFSLIPNGATLGRLPGYPEIPAVVLEGIAKGGSSRWIGWPVHAFILKGNILYDSFFKKGIDFDEWLELFAGKNGITKDEVLGVWARMLEGLKAAKNGG